MNKADMLYSKEHEWVFVEGDIAYIGITQYAQEQLGDIVFVEVPEVDEEIQVGEVICAVESVKTAADVFSPLSGIIAKANEQLDEEPELINEAPYEAWIAAIKFSDSKEIDSLMTEGEYERFCEEEE